MGIVLLLIALAMVAGGGAAVYEGYGIVLTERGWSMVIAGTVFASAGFVLFGIAIVAGRIGRLTREMKRLSDRPAESSLVVAEPGVAAPIVATSSAGMADTAAYEPAAASAPPPGPPPLNAPPLAAAMPPTEPATSGQGAPNVTAPRFGDRLTGKPEDASARRPLSSYARTPPALAAAQEETAAESLSTTVVGKYDSGGNAYVMYADGSIEADTPGGRYRFKSLDELKEFIASGRTDPHSPA